MGKLFLITGDIILNSTGMDAIVNAQNKYMINGSGICGLVYRNAGPELLKYCKDNYDKNMKVSEVRVTPGFNLNMEIIHVYAPIYKEWDNPIEKLEESYINMLYTIKEKGYKNVIVPSLGTGAHGYSHSDVAFMVIKQLYEFVSQNDVNIYFVNRYSIVTNEYYKALISQFEISEDEIKKSLLNIKECYNDFISGKDFGLLTEYEKKIYELFHNK